MTLGLRTHEEIHAELTSPARLRVLKSGLKLAELRGRADQKEAHLARVGNMLVTAAAGSGVFRGANGRILAAIAGLHGQPRGLTDLREAGKMAKTIGTHLHLAVAALPQNRLVGLTNKEKEDLSHQLRNLADYIQKRGEHLEKHNRW